MPRTNSPEQFSAQVHADRAADLQRLGRSTQPGQQHLGAQPEAAVIAELNSNPLGTLAGEANLQTPFNQARRIPDVYVVNHSRTKSRRVCVVAVSSISGAEDALMYEGPKGDALRKAYGNAENVYKAAQRRDLSIYEDRIEPANFVIQFDRVKYVIPPAPADDKDNPPVEKVQEGIWDLYVGNYERMHAVNPNGTPDEKTRAEEGLRLGLLWSRKKNPVWRVVEDGKPSTRDNPFGFIEFIREVPREAPMKVTGDFVTASELVEVE